MSFDALRIFLASPSQIRSWSHGEVLKPETINYRTFKAEKDGLFCEKIFGPVQDFKCYCGKYKGIRYKGVVCDKCGVEVTHSRVRRDRMGHISLAAPAAHPWFFRRIPSQISLLLGISPRNVRAVVYFSSYLVTSIDADRKLNVLSQLESDLVTQMAQLSKEIDGQITPIEEEHAKQVKGLDIPDKTKRGVVIRELELKRGSQLATLREQQSSGEEKITKKAEVLRKKLEAVGQLTVLTDVEYRKLAPYLLRFAKVGMGARAIKVALDQLDIDQLAQELRRLMKNARSQKPLYIKRLRVVENFRQAGIPPSNMILTVLPVIPPDIRPMVQLEGGRFATSDLNDLYRRVSNRNNRLKHLLDLGAPQVIIHNEERMLQEAVDALLDKPYKKPRYRRQKELRSLSDLLKGKKGRFRLNLLGKRVDYSGRAVIVVGPHLKLDQCGLPKEMALELFKPFVLRQLLQQGLAPNVRSAKYYLEMRSPEVWDVLEQVVEGHPVLLNRAPTLHSLGIQAFYPKLIEGNAIQIHPAVCTGYGADFDGDQMAVHVPLTKEAIVEAKELMLPARNLVKPSSGDPVVMPRQEMLIGLYFLTSVDSKIKEGSQVYSGAREVLVAHENGFLPLRGLIKTKFNGQVIQTTPGRLILNQYLPEELGLINKEVSYREVREMIVRLLRRVSWEKVAEFIDQLKVLGLEYGTKFGCSMSVFDCHIPEEKEQLLAEAEEEIVKIEKNYQRGLITEQEKKGLAERVWLNATSKLDDLAWEALEDMNPIRIMVESKARGSRDQVKQIAGMRGLLADPTGRIVELPTRSNYREGLEVFEYFTGSRGSRKGLTDKSLKTAEAGYLTRRLVDVTQELIIREEDCGTKNGIPIIRGEETALVSFGERLVGRTALKSIKVGSQLVTKANQEITEEAAEQIGQSKLKQIVVRSPMTCESSLGICARCYGRDMITSQPVKIGRAVGVIAAQSIGEPGTQLTMKTFHTGGIVGKDITQGLPRVEEIFEARVPKNAAITSEIAGRVSIIEEEGGTTAVKVKATDKKASPAEAVYRLGLLDELAVDEGDLVTEGDRLTQGFLDIKELLRTKGVTEAMRYILREVQNTYSSQGVYLKDKHIEVITRKMFFRWRVIDSGDTHLLPGDLVTKAYLDYLNKKIEGRAAKAQQVVMGITRASLCTESFLSAASFQHTVQVLTDAAISGSRDHLLGLKENVIIGRLIPSGQRA